MFVGETQCVEILCINSLVMLSCVLTPTLVNTIVTMDCETVLCFGQNWGVLQFYDCGQKQIIHTTQIQATAKQDQSMLLPTHICDISVSEKHGMAIATYNGFYQIQYKATPFKIEPNLKHHLPGIKISAVARAGAARYLLGVQSQVYVFDTDT